MKLEVTEEDITNGVRLNGASCALALAFERQVKPKPGFRVSVGVERAYVIDEATNQSICVYHLSVEASRFIYKFDTQQDVAPAIFEVTKRLGSSDECPE